MNYAYDFDTEKAIKLMALFHAYRELVRVRRQFNDRTGSLDAIQRAESSIAKLQSSLRTTYAMTDDQITEALTKIKERRDDA